MYRIGRGVKKSRRRHIHKIILVVTVLAIGGGLYALYIFMQGTSDDPITPQAITREYAPPQSAANKTFDTSEFHIELPGDWVLKDHQTTPYGIYTYQATNKNEDNRWVEIYVDNLPPNKTFNRIRPVTIQNGAIAPAEQLSDNCWDSAGSKPVPQQTYKGIQFQCDVANYSRNIVGVGAVGQGTNIRLGGRTFIIAYTDHNVRPNYQILDDMLKTFVAK